MVFLSSTLLAGGYATDYLTTFEQAVLAELNHARTDPPRYAEYLIGLRKLYRGRELHRPGEPILITEEGLPALEEAIEFLETTQPVKELVPSRGLSLGAAEHVKDQARSGALGHGGGDGSTSWERMNRHGTWQYTAAENISYGNNDARGVLIQLIVDDGTPNRGHRANIFNPAYRFVGIACGPHDHFGLMCVMDFAGGYVESGQD
ncbi:MAG: CAP domain-containing protein [Chromatiales bacterium]|jgi:hypothetical protein